MAYMSFGPPSNAPDPVKTTTDDRAREIFRDDMIPAIAEVSNAIRRREDRAAKVNDETATEATAKMMGIWQEVFDLLHKRVREEFPEIGATDRRVREAWRG